MSLHNLEKKLLAAARNQPPDVRVPYAFEKRVMAHIGSRPLADYASAWAGALWRAVAPCFAVMVLLAGWSFFLPSSPSAANDFSQEFDNTVLATATQEQVSDSTW